MFVFCKEAETENHTKTHQTYQAYSMTWIYPGTQDAIVANKGLGWDSQSLKMQCHSGGDFRQHPGFLWG